MKIAEFIEFLDKKNFSLAVENGKLALKGNSKNLSKTEIDEIKKDDFVINYIKDHKDELIGYISNSPDAGVEKKSKDISSIYGLSSLQEGMLFHGLYGGTTGAYTEQLCCDLIGPNTDLIIKSWEYILKRHSILRSAVYYDSFNVPIQCVYNEVKLPVTISDYRDMDGIMQTAVVKGFEDADRSKGFDFKKAPLMRIGLLRLDEERYRMVWTSHHILFDGWSMSILMGEFLSIYEMLSEGKEIPEVQEDLYEDYIKYLEREDKEQQEEFWRSYMEGLEQGTLLPFIAATSERTKGEVSFESVKLKFDKEITKKIESYAQKNRLTINTVIQGVWSFLLHHYTGSSDIVYGVTVSGRPDDLPGVEQRVGLYINTLPLHSTLKTDQTFTDWLLKLQEGQFSSRQHQYTSLIDIQGWTGIRGDFFDSILVFENYPVTEVTASNKLGVSVENIKMLEQTNYPMTIIVSSKEELLISFNHNISILRKEYVNEISRHFENVLMQIISNEKIRLEEIELLTKSELNQLLNEFNNTAADYPKEKSIANLFEEQAAKTPDETAVVFDSDKLTYKELNEHSNRLAHYLKSKGVKAGMPVPICIERSLEMIIGLTGILKSGGAYVPVDPDYPADRIKYILDDTGAKIIVSSKESSSKLQVDNSIEIIEADRTNPILSKQPDTNLSAKVEPDNLAYILYTSGSTGTPKGVKMPGSGLVNLLEWQEKQFVNKHRKVLQFTSLNFDVSFQEIFSTLCFGSTLFLISADRRIDMAEIHKDIEKYGITHLFIPYIVLKNLAEYISTQSGNSFSLEEIITAGEQLKITKEIEALVNKGNVAVVNQYGPTETHVVTSHTIKKSIMLPVLPPIGKPTDNTQIYILRDKAQPVAVGVSGEIYIAGAQVARGYLNLPELTKDKFISDPFSKKPGSMMYRSGDLGRWMPDGSIEFSGRSDDQIKIRGYRVEPGEIESVLQQCESVKEAVVLTKEDKNGIKHLAAYVVPKDKFNKEEIISYLRKKLPAYMVPALWAELESLPMTTNGKIDKRALPEPDITGGLSTQYEGPRNETEEKLVAIWQDLLGLDRIGVNDNFFELGGHSLLATRALSGIKREFNLNIPIKVLFEFTSIADLGKYIDLIKSNAEKPDESEVFDL